MRRLLIASLMGLGGLWLLAPGCSRDIRYQAPPPVTGEKISDVNQGWVQLFEDENFGGRVLTIRFSGHPKDHPDFNQVFSDNGQKGFNDEARSVKWQVPDGWQFVLFDGFDFNGHKLPLIGTGKVEMNPGPLQANASSGRWERKS